MPFTHARILYGMVLTCVMGSAALADRTAGSGCGERGRGLQVLVRSCIARLSTPH